VHLIHPEITFLIYKDGKLTQSLSKINEIKFPTLHPKRAFDILKQSFLQEPIQLQHKEGNLNIAGLLAHPSFNTSRTQHTYIYINNRPINDKGIQRSVYEGYSRFIPHGQKIPFILMINIEPHLIDVNVHPQKLEIRFLNPYRVYSTIQQAVQRSLENELHTYNQSVTETSAEDIAYNRLRTDKNFIKPPIISKHNSQTPTKNQSSYSDDTLRTQAQIFTSKLLEDSPSSSNFQQINKNITDDIDIRTKYSEPISIHQVFNKYIIVEYEDEIWIIDQHAAAERINFEKLMKNKDINSENKQTLLNPVTITLNSEQVILVKEISTYLKQIGFDFEIKNQNVRITAIPIHLAKNNINLSRSFLETIDEISQFGNSSKFEFDKETVIATIACHSSIRKGQKLPEEEQRDLIRNLLKCQNPYSCPHGRPAIWKLTIEEIDKHFYRTY